MIQLARVEQVEHGVLQNLGVDRQVVERTLGQTTDNGVGDGADARLERQQVVRQAAGFYFLGEEFDDVASDSLRGVVLLGKGATLVAQLGLDYGDDLVRITWDRSGTDSGSRSW